MQLKFDSRKKGTCEVFIWGWFPYSFHPSLCNRFIYNRKHTFQLTQLISNTSLFLYEIQRKFCVCINSTNTKFSKVELLIRHVRCCILLSQNIFAFIVSRCFHIPLFQLNSRKNQKLLKALQSTQKCDTAAEYTQALV